MNYKIILACKEIIRCKELSFPPAFVPYLKFEISIWAEFIDGTISLIGGIYVSICISGDFNTTF